MAAGLVAGVAMERLLLARVRGIELSEALLTIAVGMVIADGLLAAFGGHPKSLAVPEALRGRLDLGFVQYPGFRLLILVSPLWSGPAWACSSPAPGSAPPTPSYAVKKGLRYRYYVSSVLAQGRREQAGSVARVAASDIETIVVAALRAHDSDPGSTDGDLIQRSLERVTIHPDRIEILRVGDDQNPIWWDWSPAMFRRKRELIVPPGREPDRSTRPMKAEDRARILNGIARSRSWLEELTSGSVANPDALAAREGCSERAIRLMLSLAFLSPTIVQAIVASRLPRGRHQASR